jgi:serine phosphatase RsbU (regulator of sigma subunit)
MFQEWDGAVGEAQLRVGDTLALYSDGITESFNGDDEEYGELHLIDALVHNRELSSQAMLEAVVGDVRQFSCREQHDDITLIIARCTGK